MKLNLFNADASVNPPSKPDDLEEGYPIDGDEIQDIPATELGAYWVYQLVKEYENLFAEAGEEPDPDDLSQLIKVIRAVAGNIKQSTITESDPAWTPDPKTKMILFDARGGGAAGGGVNGQGTGTAGCGAAGGDAARALKLVKTISPSYSLIIGDGGVAANGVSGTDGGDTTIIDNDTGDLVNINAAGGKGGGSMIATSGNRVVTSSRGGIATGGDINISGADGSGASVVNGYPAMLSVASSVTAIWTGNGTVSSGVDAINYGCAGSGGVAESNSALVEGGFGKQGVIYVTEYQ